MRFTSVTLGVGLISLACATDIPTAARSSPAAPALAVAGNSGCYTVSGTISEVGVFPNFSGDVTGDLIGTSNTTLSFDVRATGAVIHNPGARTLTITGGTVPALVGTTIHETFEGVTIFDAPPLLRINETTRIDGGAQRGNLTTHGTLDLSAFPFVLELAYRGVVCP